MNPLIALDSVTVNRAGNRILGPLTWQLNAGERWVILGPNGAGKTTFMQLIAAVMHPSSGSVSILGEKVGKSNLFELRPRIGFVSSAMHELLEADQKVIDIVLTAAYAMTGRWIEEYDLWDESRASALLNLFGVRELRDRKYGTLSEGERKRVQIARSLMTDPEILLLDEPASSLDLGGREDILSRIALFLSAENAPASVIITHHIEEIPAGTTHVLLLKNAVEFAKGPIAQILNEESIEAVFGVGVTLTFDGRRYFAAAR
jgi:iron complex transport system ATP-binding protein